MFEKDNKEALLKKNAPGTHPGQTKDKPETSRGYARIERLKLKPGMIRGEKT